MAQCKKRIVQHRSEAIVEVFAFADQLAKAYGVPGEKAYPILNELDSQVMDFQDGRANHFFGL